MPIVTSILATQLNRWLSGSTAAHQQARRLEGQSMRVVLSGTGTSIYLFVRDGRIGVNPIERHDRDNPNRPPTLLPDRSPADVEITATPIELLKLARSASAADFGTSDVDVRGSVRAAEGFSRMLTLAVPELEDEIAGWVGGTSARFIGNIARRMRRQLLAAQQTMERSTAEFLHDEVVLCPSIEEIEQFVVAVEDLRDDVARMEQRVQRLQAHNSHVAS